MGSFRFLAQGVAGESITGVGRSLEQAAQSAQQRRDLLRFEDGRGD
jgi:hypothetical protein